jgi:organic radical activating enzyme
MKQLVKIQRDNPILFVYWTLTDFCNFRCSYCPDRLHNGDFAQGRKQGHPTDSEIHAFIDRLLELKGNRTLNVCISGGEPTLHPLYPTIVEKLKPYGIIETISNGSRNYEWWTSLPALPDKIIISLHNEWSKIDKINKTAEFLLDRGVDIAFNMMCDPAHWDATMALYDQLTDRLKTHANGKILTDHSGTAEDGKLFNYTAEQLKFINAVRRTSSTPARRIPISSRSYMHFDDGTKEELSNPFLLVNNNQHSFKGWSCSAGTNGITVHFDGYVYAGNCRIEKLGRLDQFSLRETNLVCPKQYCKTAFDIPLDKFKVSQDQ